MRTKPKSKPGIYLTLFFILITGISCSTKYRNMQSFETVWQTVNEKHYDPTFGGVDWVAAHDRYEPKIAAASSDEEFYLLTNRMLFELNLSHLLVLTREDLERYLPVLAARGTAGIDIKWMNEEALVTAVTPGSPADRIGLRPGFTIIEIDGKAVEDIVSNETSFLMPPFNPRNRRNSISNYLLGHIYGNPGTNVNIAYRDATGLIKAISIERESRGPAVNISPVMPPAIIEFESKRLPGDIAYIRFNHFAETIETKFIAAVKTMQNTRGMIIDLRGTPGGYFSVLDTIAKQLLIKKVLLYSYKFRDRTIEKVLTPAPEPYTRPVAVLIDERSLSCSELFAGSLQALKRAVVIGNRSPGYLLGADWKRLLNGAYFMHTILQPLPSDGEIIEGNGVMPDIQVSLDRKSLLEGRDQQLEAAIKYIRDDS